MLLGEKLINYYKQSPLNEEGDDRQVTYFYVGPYLVPFPNNSPLKKAIHYHNIHRLLIGYPDGRIGEGEVGAWELGSFFWNRPATFFSSFSALSIGLMYSPKRMIAAFLKGCKSRNLYLQPLNNLLSRDEEEVLNYMFNHRKKRQYLFINIIRMVFYLLLAALSIPIVLSINWLLTTRR